MQLALIGGFFDGFNMIEFIILSVFALFAFGLAIFIYVNSQKQMALMQKQMKVTSEMWMAGSFQEWNRIKTGKKPLPNKIKEEPNEVELTENNRINWEDITGVKVNGGPNKKIKIYQ